VAQLVHRQQLEYWREDPGARLAYKRQYSRWFWKWRYMVDPTYNRHERHRNSQRKARNRGNHTTHITPADLAMRFKQFDGCCCYCGCPGPLEIEHFIPRSKGGPHAIGNLLPACQQCNGLKRNHDPETWFRQQAFFTEQRWRKIRRVLGLARAPVGQLALL
jgi:5-methylcytosine-specific restriction endonuclease McrA